MKPQRYLTLALLLLAAYGLFGFDEVSAKSKLNSAAAVGIGAAVGTVIGNELSKKHKHSTTIYITTPPPGPSTLPAPGYSFSPAPGIICYTTQRACYDIGGAYSPSWTWQYFIAR